MYMYICIYIYVYFNMPIYMQEDTEYRNILEYTRTRIHFNIIQYSIILKIDILVFEYVHMLILEIFESVAVSALAIVESRHGLHNI